MSTKNEVWLEAAWETFQEAVEKGNYSLAKDVIADTKDAGFENAANTMIEFLRNTPITKFVVKSPFI